MGSWHRENPELIGTDADPWMVNESYRKMVHPSLPDRDETDYAPEPDESEDE
jgi:hypothetical protein